MSAESEMAAMISHVTNSVSGLASQSASIVATAITVLETDIAFPEAPFRGEPPDAAGLDTSSWLFPPPTREDRSPPTVFPPWPEIEFSEPPPLEPTGITVTMGMAGGKIAGALPEFPDLSLPTFNYPSPARMERFLKVVPSISTTIEMPTLPEMDRPNTPSWMPLAAITLPSLSMPATEFASIPTDITASLITYEEAVIPFKDAIFNGSGGLPGLDALLTEQQVWLDDPLNALIGPVMAVLQERFTDASAKILQFHEDIQQRLTQRLDDERQRVTAAIKTDRSGWDLPALVQQALDRTVQQVASSWVQQAESQAETRVEALKMEFLETCGTLYESLHKSLVTIKAKEIEYVLEAHKLSIAYAKQAIKGLLSAYSVENFTQQDFAFKKAEAELQLFEANLKISMVRYELARAKLEIEKARQDQDTVVIKQYQHEMDEAELEAKLYASQVGAARAELSIKQLPYEVFEAQVKAFDAQIDGHTALVNSRIAELEGDTAKIASEKAKVAAYASQARGFAKTVQVKRETVNSQIARNEAVVAQYEAEIKALFAPLEQSLLLNEYELQKYTILAEDYLTDARVAAKAADIELDFLQREQDGLMTAFKATQEQGIDLMNYELKRLEGVADINARGATVMASMAGGAMSAANGIASLVFSTGA